MFLQVGFGWALRICGFICLALTAAAGYQMIRSRLPPGQDHNSLRSTFSAHLRIPFSGESIDLSEQLKIIDKIFNH